MPSRRIEASLSPVVKRWANQDKELLWPLFGEIREGNGARRQKTSTDRESLVDSLATLDAFGRVIELFGITRDPTSHRVIFAGEAVFSCCALVAHTVPAIFESAATVESVDPISGENVTVRISNEMQLQEMPTADIYGSLVDWRPTEQFKNPRDRFCRHVKHFSSAESAEAFCSQDNRRYYVPIAEFNTAAQSLFRQIWGPAPLVTNIRT